MQFSRWLLWILLLGCGARGGQSKPIATPGDLPVDVQGNREISLGRLQSAIAAGDMSSNTAIAKTVTALYFDSGFMQVKIKISQDSQHILVHVDEGAQFVFGALHFQGAGRTRLPGPRFRSGDVFSSSKLGLYMETLRSYCADRKIEVALTPLTLINEQARSVDITIEVQPPSTAALSDLEASECIPTPDIGRGEALVLRRDEVVTLGPARPYYFSRICVRDVAAIRVCQRAEIRVANAGSVVIAGRGIGSNDSRPAELTLRSLTRGKLHVLFENAGAPIRAHMFVPQTATLVYAVTGRANLTLGGGSMRNRQANGRLNDTRNFPSCF